MLHIVVKIYKEKKKSQKMLDQISGYISKGKTWRFNILKIQTKK